MRICMLLRNPFTRDARVLKEARGLANAGHEVIVLALKVGELPQHEQRDGFTIIRSVEAGMLAGPTIGGGAGATGRRMPRPSAAVWFRDRILTSQMTRAARAIPAEAYHAHDLNTLQAASEAAAANRALVVYDAHELYPDLTGLRRGERARWSALETRLIGRADRVIVPSRARGDELVRRYRIAPPAVVMNCPPLTAAPDPSSGAVARLRHEGEALVVYAGGFTPNRGLENIVEAMSSVPSCRLAMIGWGPLEATLRARAASNDRVEFLAPVDPDDVVATVAGADVGLAAYLPVGLNNTLAAPNKLFEYLHAGLAIAASDLPDIRHVVEDLRVGELFDASDPASIAAAIGRIV